VIIQLRGELRLEVDGSRVEGSLPGRLGRAISQATGLRLFETQARAELEELATPSG
jgi:hypothetical protein